jgi:hypothetical protein
MNFQLAFPWQGDIGAGQTTRRPPCRVTVSIKIAEPHILIFRHFWADDAPALGVW